MARLDTLIIEGWRGICQSYAMVNQHQILQLLNSGLKLYHDDVPFWQPGWKVDTKTTGFTEEETRRIFSLPPSPKTRIPNSALFRIQHPLNFADDPRVDKIFIFAVNELQHLKWQLPSRQFHYARGNPRYHIVTPSAWARQGILNEGFADWQVSVVPHGVDTSVYFPETAQYRQTVRARLGVQQDEVLLFSAGSMTPSKGVDVCLHLYARLRRQNPKVRLMLKDAGPTYGITVFDFLQKFVARNPGLLTSEDLTALLIAPSEITQRGLADLYRATDLYVSTYRAEGFNLMALEARHCGTKIMVTQGGASDAYADPATDLLVPAERVENGEGVWLEPRIDAATASAQLWMASRQPAGDIDTQTAEQGWTWRKATACLFETFQREYGRPGSANTSIAARTHRPTVSLVIADTYKAGLSRFAIDHSRKLFAFDELLVFSDEPSFWGEGIRFIPIPTIRNIADYNRIILRDLAQHLTTDFALIVQFDGFVLNAGAWTDSFFSYDYIGAPWPKGSDPEVGNGGFSLRSRSLIQACAELFQEKLADVAEDVQVCSHMRSALEAKGLQFARRDIASKFSFELHHPGHDTFGFHGVMHLPQLFSDFGSLLENIPPLCKTQKSLLSMFGNL